MEPQRSKLTVEDCLIDSLGKAKIESPLGLSLEMNDGIANYITDDCRFLVDPTLAGCQEHVAHPDAVPASFESAGPRPRIYFDPSKLHAAIVTCGGLCPGMNNVIRGLVMQLWYRYGVRRISGIRYGYQGFVPKYRHAALDLDPDLVVRIHEQGGTFLGSSRGLQSVEEMVDSMERMGIGLLFVIGGDGSMRGAQALYREITSRGMKIAVVGVPKTIDNDIPFIEKTFGFDTAVSVAVEAIRSAHIEAKGAPNGIGLVKLMGRHSGYIAAQASLACRDANLVLIPEQPFDLDGPRGLFQYIQTRLTNKGHVVIVVAEGAGQSFFAASNGTDASGNKRLNDIGRYLEAQLKAHFKQTATEINLKYIDPSYIIRASPAIPSDAIFCANLASHAVHAGLSGKTGMVVGLWSGRFVHAPLTLVTTGRKSISLDSALWLSVLEATGQPYVLANND